VGEPSRGRVGDHFDNIKPAPFHSLPFKSIPSEILKSPKALEVRKAYESLSGTDQVAKGTELVKKTLASAKRSIARR
jgi:hypothetical protein